MTPCFLLLELFIIIYKVSLLKSKYVFLRIFEEEKYFETSQNGTVNQENGMDLTKHISIQDSFSLHTHKQQSQHIKLPEDML